MNPPKTMFQLSGVHCRAFRMSDFTGVGLGFRAFRAWGFRGLGFRV